MSNHFDLNSGIIEEYSPAAELQYIDLPKENQVLVVKIDIEKYDIDVACNIYKEIAQSLKQYDITMIGIPKDIIIENWTIREIDALIDDL